jgi:hypothetical protein
MVTAGDEAEMRGMVEVEVVRRFAVEEVAILNILM